jgi:radical S-adenosyl methionine domain-containing protein 2
MNYHYSVVNFHIVNSCNYACRYCFGKFGDKSYLSLPEAEHVVAGIADYFRASGITQGRINLAGGEPLLYPYLDELIDFIHEKGIAVSIVTNGSLLTPSRIGSWRGKVACIGLSVDALSPEVNRAIGRCCHGEVKDLTHWTDLADACHEAHIALKINTVVSKLNLQENLLPLYRACRPQRIKLLKMHLVENVNDEARLWDITDSEFSAFCERHEFANRPVRESEGSMENSYLMVDPSGTVLLNDHGVYKAYGSCLTESFSEIACRLPLDSVKYAARYGGEVGA